MGADLKASPLPPAPLLSSGNQWLADLQTERIGRSRKKLDSRVEINENIKNKNRLLYIVDYLILFNFWLLLGFPDNHFLSLWRSLGTIWAPFCNQVGHGCTQMDPGRSQDGFFMIFDTFWVPLWTPCWITF